MRARLFGCWAALGAAGLMGCGSNDGASTTRIVYVASDAGPAPNGGGEPSEAGSSVGRAQPVPSLCTASGNEIRLTSTANDAHTPTIGWTGAEYLVAWSDDRSGASDIFAARVSPAGGKLGPEWAVAATPAPSLAPSLAAGPTGLLVGWSEGASPALDLLVQALDATGQPVGAPSTTAASRARELRPRLAAAFDGVAAAWADEVAGGAADAGVEAAPAASGMATSWIARLTSSGATASPGGAVRLGQGAATYPALGGTPSALAAAYVVPHDGLTDVRLSLYDATLAPTGDVLVRSGASPAQNLAVGWDGAGFVLAWEDLQAGDEQIEWARVRADGTVDGPRLVPEEGSGGSNWPAIASDGSSTVVTYYQFRDGPPQIYLSLFGPDGTKRGGDLQVSQSASGKARFAAVARGAAGYGVVWEDTRFGNSQIFFTQVSCP